MYFKRGTANQWVDSHSSSQAPKHVQNHIRRRGLLYSEVHTHQEKNKSDRVMIMKSYKIHTPKALSGETSGASGGMCMLALLESFGLSQPRFKMFD